ncbi:MAG: lysophospholipid acyltransferase family protein [Gemmatimonadetes bacterium]|nr:lysophospholipid acyltransferase family protein [Gemmatimonadota bacterium]
MSAGGGTGATRAPTLTLRLSIALGRVLIRLLARTWRVRRVGWTGLDRRRGPRPPVVLVIWHGEMLATLWFARGQGIAALVSEHKDGEIIAQVATGMGWRMVRGSSSRGAARALLGLVRVLRDGGDVIVTPDGPRGPAHSFAPGALAAAQRGGAPVVVLRVHASRAWRLGSWDGFMIPKPFARVTLALSAPVPVAPAPAHVEDEVPRFAALMAATGREAGDAD